MNAPKQEVAHELSPDAMSERLNVIKSTDKRLETMALRIDKTNPDNPYRHA